MSSWNYFNQNQQNTVQPYFNNQSIENSSFNRWPEAQAGHQSAASTLEKQSIPTINYSLPSQQLSHNPTMLVLDNDELKDDLNEKDVAAKRFRKNDGLMKAVMSEAIVPNFRQPLTIHKLKVLKKRVSALEKFISKEKEESVELEAEFNRKLDSFNEKKREFDTVYTKLCQPITETQVRKFSDFIYERFRKKLREQCELKEILDDSTANNT